MEIRLFVVPASAGWWKVADHVETASLSFLEERPYVQVELPVLQAFVQTLVHKGFIHVLLPVPTVAVLLITVRAVPDAVSTTIGKVIIQIPVTVILLISVLTVPAVITVAAAAVSTVAAVAVTTAVPVVEASAAAEVAVEDKAKAGMSYF